MAAHSAIPPVLHVLAESRVTVWKMATWLFTPSTALEGQAPIAWLKAGREVEAVLVDARNAPPTRAAPELAPD